MAESIQEHAKRLHEQYIALDAHFDLLMEVDLRRKFGYRKVIETEFLPILRAGGVSALVCSLFIESEYLPEMGLKMALDQVSALYSEIEESPDKLQLCTTYDEIIDAHAHHKLAILLSLEGVDPLTNDLGLLQIFYQLGVRFVGLTWSRRNFAADGSHFHAVDEGHQGGLTEFGVQLVKEAEKLNMIIDVSHLNDVGLADVLERTNGPIIASHSNARSIASSMRNLTDEQLCELAARGGVIGMNGFNAFVSDSYEDGDVSHLMDHLDYIVNLAGIEHVGIGLDICNFLSEIPLKPAGHTRDSYDVISSHRELPLFTEELIRRGYSDEEIGLIIGGNFLNVYKKILK
ncbi:dipeptidase [Sporolactobacillus nakayamae]|uniref:Membrane dipeptidase n=1 Tax=Sporolactobacillus nakayamae TaxID=269670 RepID=A0A1I2PPD5_9BACL|nr:dipeptidase [Sporolactobacillus nakayamae]SFG16979.1 membrane dipeptidase [Sporolactobacillus nakayamae]